MNGKLEEKLIRCPRLGDEITLNYCLTESIDLPCARIVRCWSSVFDVAAWLEKKLPPQLWEKFVNNQPQDKVTSIIELILQAKARK